MPDTHTTQTTVSFSVPYQYPVFFTRDIFASQNCILRDFLQSLPGAPPYRALAIIDSGVEAAHPGLQEQIIDYSRAHPHLLELADSPLTLPGGEAAKNNFDEVQQIIKASQQHRLCRQSLIICIGGGAVLDAVGFAASLIHRGMRLIRVPTTVLAQNDSGIGVKNGINLNGVKNFLGVFAPPTAVFNDSSFLPTLEDRDWISGIAEAFKVGIIKDADFLKWLNSHNGQLRHRDLAAMEEMIRRCAELHVQHIAEAGDPFEFGSARPLDFGHWAGHKLETMSDHRLRHGEAVAIGMALDLLNAASLNYISIKEAENLIKSFKHIGLPVWTPLLKTTDQNGQLQALQGIDEFRQHLGGTLHITLPRPLGAKYEVKELPVSMVEASIEHLQKYDSDN